MITKVTRFSLFSLMVICLSTFVLNASNNPSKKSENMPASWFSTHSIMGSSVMEVTAVDVGDNNISFTNPYNTSSTENVWAGYFKGTIDGNAAKFYCIDISHYIAFYTTSQPHTYTDNGTTPAAITYILNNYFPYKSLPYTGSLSSNDEAAAVQVAIWHFSDGVDATTVNNSTVKNRALAIISDANTNSGSTTTLTTFAILPATQTLAASTTAQMSVEALDASSKGVANLIISLSTTSGTLSTTACTTATTGLTPTFNLNPGSASSATITAVTSFTIPQGTKYEHSVSPNGYQKLVLATPTTANRQSQATVNWNPASPTCSMTGYTTYTQGGWGSPSNSAPGTLRDSKFATVFPSGLTIGGTKTAKFSTATTVKNFLPAGGTAAALTTNYTDPTCTSAGVFGGQVVALALNVAFSDAGVLGNGTYKLGQLVITSGALAGVTVYNLLNYANTALGGGSTPYAISDLNTACDNINSNFDGGSQNLGYLTCPAQQPVTIGDFVWIDANKNGIQDAGEKGLAGVTVQLYDCSNNLKATTTTDTSGLYRFTNITPGSYYVKFTQPANYAFTLKNQGTDKTKDSDVDPTTGQTACTSFSSGAVDLTWDCGVYFNKANLGDRVWNDVNMNGIQDDATTEPGISGVTVKLYNCSTSALVATTTTDVNGNYLFANLDPGSYYIMVTLPTGFTFSPKTQGSDVTKDSDVDPSTGKSACVTLAAGDNNLTVDAGMYTSRVNIGDFVWNDLNKNGIQDAGEPGVSNVTVKLYNCAGTLLATTTTDSTGLYKFNNLDPAVSYYVQFTLPANYNFTLKNQGTDQTKDSDADPSTGKTACKTLTPGQTDLTWDAGIYYNKASLGDRVWLDANENGIQDAGEAGVQGVTVKLYDCSTNNLIATTTTNASGNYLFSSLTAGSYYVVFTAPAGYSFSPQAQGNDSTKDSDANVVSGKTTCITLNPGDNNLTVDAGLHVSHSSIGDLVWLDANQNGIQDNGEKGYPGITVKLYDCSSNFIATTTTDSTGKYAFNNLLPGSYYVLFTLPAGYTFSAQNQGTDTTADSDVNPLTGRTNCINLAAGITDVTRDAGIYLPKASVGDKVWNDLNHDGTQDNPASELGIPNVVVKLFDCSNNPIFTTTTDQNGNYLFSNLTPGSYYIQFVAPSGYAITLRNNTADTTKDSDPDPATGKTNCFVLTPGENDLTKDAGMYFNRASVGDLVWKDLNRNGIQDNGEPGLAGVTVRLYDCSNNVIATTVTDNTGHYSFTNLIPGSYYEQFFLPTGYSFSPQTQGTNTAVDSDPDAKTGLTTCKALTAGQNDVTWDAGMYETATTYADLSLTKTADKTSVQNNDVVTYTITVKNNGPNNATGVTVSDVLPAGLQFVSASPAGAYDTVTGIWTIGAIANGASKSLQISVKVNVTNINQSVVNFGPAKDYNMFVLQDMDIPSSDTQGKLAIGHDANLQGYSVADQLPATDPMQDMLVVGHDLTFLSGRVYNGNAVYGNATNLPRTSVSIDGTLRKDTVIDFNAAAAYLNSLSAQLAAQIVNGTTVYQTYNEVTLTGTDPFLNVFTVDGTKLAQMNNTSITAPNGSVVLVNVSGHNINWGYGLSVNGTAHNNALFNFYEADTLVIHGIDVTGSILAPKANVNFTAGVQHGQMICKSYHGQGQLNLDPFVGNLPISKDIVNSAEVRTSDMYDPNSTPGNGITSENDYGAITVHVGIPTPSSTSFKVVSIVPSASAPLAIADDASGITYAGTASGQIYQSTNSGTSWSSITGDLAVGTVRSIVPSTGKTTKLIAGTDKGVFTSTNGSTWAAANLANTDVRSIVAGPNGKLLAATWGSGIYQSADQGHTWLPMNAGLTNLNVNSIYVDNNSEILAATFGGGIYKYSVLNSTWVPAPIAYKYAWSIYAASNGALYATTYGGGVYRSFDGGDNWKPLNKGLNNPYIYAVAEDKNANLVAISWAGGVSSLSRGSETWTTLGLDGAGVSSVNVNPTSGTILVGTKDGSVYSTNGALGVKNTVVTPKDYTLSQNYPNPFNPTTKINFSVPNASHVTLIVYNILGQEVRRLVNSEMASGNYTVSFDAHELASGIYIYRFTADKVTITKKMMLVK